MPNALSALDRLGLDAAAVDYVFLTHIHLDHAGGAGRMMAAFPNAKLVVHPRGVRHMAEPSRLVAGVSAVYGPEYVQRVYGEILPIPAERIIEAPDGLVVSLAGRELLCLDTPGHARHHICIVDKRTKGIFTGDMFGLSYRELDVDGRQFIFPTTTPTQFEPEEMRMSIQRLLSFDPEAMYLTHYSQIDQPQQKAADLLRHLDVNIYFDSLVHDKLMLQYLLNFTKPTRIPLGSDYPFPLGEDIPGMLIKSMWLEDDVKQQLVNGTALEWLGMDRSFFEV